MLTKTILLALLPQSKVTSDRLADVDGKALPNERPEDDVVGNEDQVEISLLVAWVGLRGGRDAVGYEQERSEGVGYVTGDVGGKYLPVCPKHDYQKEELEGGSYGARQHAV